MKQSRARSVEEKQKIFDKIIKNGRDLFLKHGSSGFNMRSLATKLNLVQGSLYTYVHSKRDLWFAIVQDDINKIVKKMILMRDRYEGKNTSLMEDLVKLFFETLKTDSQALQIMFRTTPPSSKKMGPIERNYEVGIVKLLEEIIEEAISKREIKIPEPSKLALYIWSLMYGNAIIAHTEIFGPKENIPGYKSSTEYYNFVIERIDNFIESVRKR